MRKPLPFCFVFFLLVLASTDSWGLSTTYDWTGAISTAWNNPGNWNVGMSVATDFPGDSKTTDIAQIGVVAFPTAHQPTLNTVAALTINTLTIGSLTASVFTINAGLIINNTATISGIININAALTVNGLTTVSNGSTINSNSSGTFTTQTIAVTGSTITLGAPLTVTGGANALTFVSGNTTITNTSSAISTTNMLVSAGTVSLGAPTTVSGSKTTLSSGSSLITSAVFTTPSLTVTGSTITLGAQLNITNTGANALVFVSGTTTITNTSSAISCSAGGITENAGTVNLGAPTSLPAGTLNITGIFNVNATLSVGAGGGTTVTNGTLTTTAILTTTTLDIINSTVALNAQLNITNSGANALTFNSVNTDISTINNTASLINLTGATGGMSITAGTVNLGAPISALGGKITVSSGSVFNSTSSGTINAVSMDITTASLSLNGSVTLSGNLIIESGNTTLNCASTFTATGLTTNTGTLTLGTPLNLGAGIFLITPGSTTTLNGSSSIAVGTLRLGSTATFINSGSTITCGTLDDSSNGIFSNAGTITATSSVVATTTSSFTNTGKFYIIGTSPTFSCKAHPFSNSGLFDINGTAVTLQAGTSFDNAAGGVFYIYNNSTVTFSAATSTITNEGTFYLGKSNSACSITLDGPSCTMINNGGNFYLGSTSIITITGKTASVSNTSGVFTLMSDQYGSASIGTIAANATGFIGNFNAERYMTGGPAATYRTYRLLSSPTNITSATSGLSNYIDFSNFSNNGSKNNYIVLTTPTTPVAYYGAFTGGTTGFSISNGSPTMYLYNETLNPSAASANSSFTSGKNVGITAISGSSINWLSTVNGSSISGTNQQIPVGNGFLIFFIGSSNPAVRTSGTTAVAPDNTYITNVGNINQQNVTVNLWYTPTGGSAGQLSYTAGELATNFPGYVLVGNPYASTIDLQQLYNDNFKATTNAISSNFYELYDVNPQNYYVWQAGGANSGTIASEYIASGQGFFAQALAVGESLVFKEDQKVYQPPTPPLLMATPDKALSLNNAVASVSPPPVSSPQTRAIKSSTALCGLHLKMDLVSNGANNDECGIYFNSKWSDKYDINDAYDRDGINPSVYLSSYTSDGVRCAINKMGAYIPKSKRIKLYVKGVTDGNYNLELEDFQNIDTALYDIYLVDHKNQDSLDVVHNKAYVFAITNADTTSFGANRFELVLEQKPLPPYQLISFTGQKVKDGVQLTWKTTNEGNYTGFDIQKLDDSKQYIPLYNVQSDCDGTYTYIDPHPVKGDNTYRLQQIDIDSLVSYSKPLDVLYHGSTANNNLLSVYPNPAKDLITVAFSSTTSALTDSYLSSIYNAQGKLMMQQTANSNTWTQDVSALKPGAYVIQVTAANGNSIGNSKFVRVQ